jgi:hypothetical protein
MALHFLRDFPREIRDQIYIHVLRSSTGYITLSTGKDIYGDTRFKIRPYDGTKTTSAYNGVKDSIVALSLLQTCKQIHEETKDVLWAQNEFVADGPLNLLSVHDGLPRSLRLQIERVNLNVDFTDRRAVKWTAQALRSSGEWSREGSLKRVTLTVLCQTWERGAYAVEKLIKVRQYGVPMDRSRENVIPRDRLMLFQEYIAVLKEAGGQAGYLSHLERIIVFDAEWRPDRPSHRRLVIGFRNPRCLIEDMHGAFGGEFWMDGLLCFKDHVEISDILRRNSWGP